MASDANLVDDRRIREIEEALPDLRWNLSVRHAMNRLDLLARVRYIDTWYDARDGWTYDGFALLDLEAAMPLNGSTRLTVGLRNALDNRAGRNPNPAAIGNVFSSLAPFDTNGLFGYARLEYGWGVSTRRRDVR